MDEETGIQKRTLTRREFLAAGVGATGLVVLGGCGGSDSSNKSDSGEEPKRKGEVTLTFWTWVPGMENAVKLFNDKHKGSIQVKLNNIPTGAQGGYQKMFSALKAGNAPDVAQVEYQQVPAFLLTDGLVDIGQYAEQHKSKFVDWQWKQGVYNETIYAIPQASGPMGLYYRKDLFDKWGISSPKTWDEFATAAAKIHKKDSNSYICTFPSGNSAWFTSLAWQAGAKWFSAEGDTWVVDIDNAPTHKVASYWQELVNKGLVKTESDNSNAFWKDVQSGSLVTYVAASWIDAPIRGNAPKTKGQWRVADMPQWGTAGAFTASNWGGSSTAVMKGSKYPREATEFAVWLNSDPQSVSMLVNSGYGWPAIKDLGNVEAIKKPAPEVSSFYSGQNINEVFMKADEHVDESWGWTPVTDTTFNSLNDGLTAAVNGKGTFSGAVKKAQEDTVSALKAKGLKVKTG